MSFSQWSELPYRKYEGNKYSLVNVMLIFVFSRNGLSYLCVIGYVSIAMNELDLYIHVDSRGNLVFVYRFVRYTRWHYFYFFLFWNFESLTSGRKPFTVTWFNMFSQRYG